jgi:hypothetical protein
MLTLEHIQNKFDVTISPIIDNADENNDTRSVSSGQLDLFNFDTPPTAARAFEDKPHPTTARVYEDKPRSSTARVYEDKPKPTAARVFEDTLRPTAACVFEDKPHPASVRVYENKPRQTTIKLRPDWAMIAAHPTFKLEYKEFIRNDL